MVLAGCGGRGASGPPVEVVVVSPRATVLGKDASKPIGAGEIERIRGRREVVNVVPRMELRGRALGAYTFEGQEIKFEVGGFTDGIPASAVEPALAATFVDLDPASPARPVPALLSPVMVQLYNQKMADQHDLPRLGPVELDLAIRSGRLVFTITLGDSMVPAYRDPPPVTRTIDAVIVGVSPRAKSIGLTVPIGYVAAWNRELVGNHAAGNHSSLVVTLRDGASLKPFTAWIENELELELESTP